LITWEVTKQTAVGLVHFFASVFTLSADLTQVSGPVGIAGAVGNASDSGISPLLTLTAIISVNLALINLLPIPALDGGRLLFVAIEAVTRRPMRPQVAGAINAIGFGFLILLMVAVTVSDIFKIVG
jgi:regulator of sigma E protease